MLKKIKRFWFQLTHPIIGEVWELHRVRLDLSKDKELRTYEITPSRLESLIVQYKQKGYEFISMDEVYEYVLGIKKCKNKFVAITLDDGYEDNFSIAYPIFKLYNIPFCIYVVQAYILGEKKASDRVDFKMLTIEQLKKLSKEPLCTIGGHTLHHSKLNCLTKEEQYKEINECKIWLENLINISINHYAFPYGAYSEETLNIIKKIGIKCSVAAWGGGIRMSSFSQFDVPRKLITMTSV